MKPAYMLQKLKSVLKQVVYFYFEGFRNMGIGKKLWVIILVKFFIMFAILKMFFFRDFLALRFEEDSQRSTYVIEQLTDIK